MSTITTSILDVSDKSRIVSSDWNGSVDVKFESRASVGLGWGPTCAILLDKQCAMAFACALLRRSGNENVLIKKYR